MSSEKLIPGALNLDTMAQSCRQGRRKSSRGASLCQTFKCSWAGCGSGFNPTHKPCWPFGRLPAISDFAELHELDKPHRSILNLQSKAGLFELMNKHKRANIQTATFSPVQPQCNVSLCWFRAFRCILPKLSRRAKPQETATLLRSHLLASAAFHSMRPECSCTPNATHLKEKLRVGVCKASNSLIFHAIS